MARVRRNITRRGALAAAGAAAAATAAIGVLSGCTHTPEREIPSEPVVVGNDEAAVVTGEDGDFEYVDGDFEPMATWELPLGNVLHPGEGDWIPVTSAGTSATPMVRASALRVSSGELSEVMGEPMGAADPNVVIYDVRCSDAVYAWVELDVLTRAWTLYAAGFSGGELTGSPVTLWQADADWAPPYLAVTGERVIWQVMPALSGGKTSERSVAYLWRLGAKDAAAVVESPGRFATAPAVSGDTVTLTPRVRADQGVYYGITAYALADDLSGVVDRLVMPQGVRPFFAVRIGDEFAFSVEANYESGGLLGRMGTYFGVADGAFTSVPMEPFANVVGNGQGRYVVKSRASYYVVDTEARTYTVLSACNRCVDYGEYPAREGEARTFVTFSTIKDADTGYPTKVVAREFAL